jgi:hypothetical protein
LHRALRTRFAKAVEHLLATGADPLIKNNSGFDYAQKKIVQTFVRFGVSPTASVFDTARSDWIRALLG